MAKELGQRPNAVREWDEDEVLGLVAYSGLQAEEAKRTTSPVGTTPPASGGATKTTVYKLKQRKKE